LRSGSVATFNQGQDSSGPRLRGFPLGVDERPGVQGIHQGQQLAAVGVAVPWLGPGAAYQARVVGAHQAPSGKAILGDRQMVTRR
jgi:hypothetical protein